MSLLPAENSGDRPSHLALGRYVTGELSDAEAGDVENWLATHPEGQAYLKGLESSRNHTAPFDATALRTRSNAERDLGPSVATPKPANPAWRPIGLLFAAALVTLLTLPNLVGTTEAPSGPESNDVMLRGGPSLQIWREKPGGIGEYEGGPMGEGETLGFKVDGSSHRSAIILSVDGRGAISVFSTNSDDSPFPVTPGIQELQLSAILDDAPGPEVFVAAFDREPDVLRDELRQTWQRGGADAVQAWAKVHPDLYAVRVERR
jgi:hypothetical protein